MTPTFSPRWAKKSPKSFLYARSGRGCTGEQFPGELASAPLPAVGSWESATGPAPSLKGSRGERRGDPLGPWASGRSDPGEGAASRLLGNLAYRSVQHTGVGWTWVLLETGEVGASGPGSDSKTMQPSPPPSWVLDVGEPLATTLVGIASGRIAAVTASTNAFYANRLLGRPQGRIKDLRG